MSEEELELNNNFSEIFPTHGGPGKVKHKKGLALGNTIPIVTATGIGIALLLALPATGTYRLPPYPGPAYTAPSFNPAPYPTVPPSTEVTPEVTPEVIYITPEPTPEPPVSSPAKVTKQPTAGASF